MADHATPNIPSRDFEATSRFYGALGFAEGWRGEGWMILKRGSLTLEFFHHPELDPLTSWFSACLRLEDLDGFYALCRDAGVAEACSGQPRLHPPRTEAWGGRVGALIDPDGTLIRLIQNGRAATDQTSRARDHWDAVYATKSPWEVSWFEASPDRSIGWIAQAGADKDDAVIDVGGGLSSLAEALAARGFSDVTVLDISEAAVRAHTEKPATKIQGVVADITAWRPTRTYKVWHDRAVLHFLQSEPERGAYRDVLLQALAPGGAVIIATFAPDGPERCSGLPVRRYGLSDLADFLGPEFVVEASELFDHTTPGGAIQRFQAGRFRRRIR